MSIPSWRGKLLHIFLADDAGAPMTELQEAKLIAGVGIEGDRYAKGVGHYSLHPRSDRQVTLIEMETLEALERDCGIRLQPFEPRRNIVTRDVPLNHLVGRRFSLGGAVLYGDRLSIPCRYLEELVCKPVFAPLLNRAGLNCQILESGVIRRNDFIWLEA
jgi:MOSC domain-containing protein YiiM